MCRLITATMLTVGLSSLIVADIERAERQLVLYVDDDAPPDGDGLSWQTALRYLQDALALASDPPSGIDVAEIRVAQGTYKPDQGANQTPGDIDESFFLVNGVAMRGGFAGMNAQHPDKQDPAAFPTILSGDLLGDDGPGWSTPGNSSDNSRCVVRAINLDQETEGMIITRGLRGVPFPNSFNNSGGGIYGIGSRLHIRDCMLERNGAPRGGGVALLEALDTTIERCTFDWNRASVSGGGAHIQAASEQTLISVAECLFTHQNIGLHTAIMSHGALLAPSHSMITRCDFVNNYALAHVGGASGGTFIDCTFAGNSSDEVGGVAAQMLIDCDVSGNVGIFGTGGGTVVNAVATTFTQNVASSWTGNPGGGGVHSWGNFVNCNFVQNHVFDNGRGGAALAPSGSFPRFVNCLFDGNSSDTEGGTIAVVPRQASAAINNCTFVHAASAGPGSVLWGNGEVDNSIIWSAGPNPVFGDWSIRYSSIEGGWPGVGNIDVDPMFRDPLNGDFRLQPASPCIDAGDNQAVPPDEFDLDSDGDVNEPIPIDLVGMRRFRNDPHTPDTGNPGFGLPPIDMGAYEFQLLEDINQDGRVGVPDLLLVINSWGPCADPRQCPADVAPYPEGNGFVDVWDLIAVVMAWGQ